MFARRLLTHFVAYAVDMTIAITGFVMGFGLKVESWAWLIGAMIFARFCFHILQHILYHNDHEEKNLVK